MVYILEQPFLCLKKTGDVYRLSYDSYVGRLPFAFLVFF